MLLWGILAMIGCAVGGSWYEGYLIEQQRMLAVTLLSSKGYALSAAVNRRFSLLNGLHVFAQTTSTEAKIDRQFQVFAAGLHAGTRDVRNFALAPKGVIRYLYPLQGNERAIGHDLLSDPLTREDALRALKTGRTALSRPYRLRQGGLALVARKPVLVAGEFWGFVTMVVDIPSMLTDAGMDHQDRFETALRDSSGKVFHGDGGLWRRSPLTLRIELPEGYWELAAVPQGGWQALVKRDLLLFRGMTVSAALLLSLVIMLAWDRQRRLHHAVRDRGLALKDSESYNRTLFELSPIGLVLCRMDGVLVDVNPAFADILGRTAAETVGLDYREITPENYTDQERLPLEALEATGSYGPYEKVFRHKDGRLVPVRLQGRIIKRNKERFIWSSVEDISTHKQAEEMLRKSESLLAETQHLAKVGGWEYDVERRALLWTDEVYAIHDLSPGSYDPGDIGRNLQFYPSPGRELIQEAFRLALTKAEPYDLELQFVSVKGRRLWVRIIGNPKVRDGRVVRVVGNLIDITERRHLEEVLKERNEQLTLFAEHAPAAIAMLDRDLRYMVVSRRFLQEYKLGDQEIVGRSHYQVFPEVPEHWREIHRRCLAGAIEKSEQDAFVRADGSTDWLRWEIHPWSAATGEIGGIIIFSEDISERRRADAAIRREHDFSEALIDSLPGVVYLFDQQLNFLRWNKNFERVTGYGAEEIGRLSPLDLFGPTDKELLRDKIGEVFVSGASSVEADFVSKNGGRIPYLFTGVRTEIDDRVCLIGIGIDISARKRLEQELTALNLNLEARVAQRTGELQASRLSLVNMVEDLNEKSTELVTANEKLKGIDQLKSMFIASMSHELRTPLNSVIGYTSILMNEWLGPVSEEQKQHLAIVLRAGKHLLSLINDVIDISKIEARQIETTAEPFDLFDLVAEACGQLEPEIHGKGLALLVDNAHLLLTTDRRRLLQVTLNVLSNAMKYTLDGSIHLTVKLDGAWAELTVRDTGIGIGDQQAELIFRPFVRLDSQLRNKVPGTGLGLYLSHRLMTEVLKGTISFTSRPGEGSTFVIRVPAAAGVPAKREETT